jgi:FkbM family methyltransferase
MKKSYNNSHLTFLWIRSPFKWKLISLLKYLIIFFRKIDSSLYKRANFESFNNSEFILVNKTKKNPENFIAFSYDKVVSKHLYLNGSFSMDVLEKSLKILKKKEPLDVLIDVGANIGSTTIPALVRGYFKNAVCIEPDIDNYNILSANIYLNKLDINKVKTFNFAVGSKDNERLFFKKSKNNSGDHRIVSKTNLKNTNLTKSFKLDTIIHEHSIKISKNSLIWMDAQGYEPKIIVGSKKLVRLGIPMVIEIMPNLILKNNLLDLLISGLLNYKYYFDLDDKQNVRYNMNKNIKSKILSIKKDHVNFLLVN